METNIIIRTKNEQKWVGVVLEKLQKQTYQDFEIIIVDSGSTNDTLRIVQRYTSDIIKIKQKDFSYSYALNIGCKSAKAQKYFVFLSAHSVPISDTWLQDGVEDFSFTNNVAGVYGDVWALQDATVWEKLIFNKYLGRRRIVKNKKKVIRKNKMGVLGFTNAIIRRDLWEVYNLNEEFGAGGEDSDWAQYWLNKDYVIINDAKFAVYHSHRLGLIGLYKQYKHWKEVAKPRPFSKQDYRK